MDNINRDLMRLVHDVVGATVSIKACINNIRRDNPDNEILNTRLTRLESRVSQIDNAVDSYYINEKKKCEN